MERVAGRKHIGFDSNETAPGKDGVNDGRKWDAKKSHTFSCAEDWVEILRGIGTSRRCSTTVICSDRRQNMAVPSTIVMPE